MKKKKKKEKKRKKEVTKMACCQTVDRDKKEFKRRSPITGRWLLCPPPPGNLDHPLDVSIPELF